MKLGGVNSRDSPCGLGPRDSTKRGDGGRRAEEAILRRRDKERVLNVSFPFALAVLLQEQAPIRLAAWTATISSPGFYSSFTVLSVVDIGVKYIFILYNKYPAVREETTRLASKMAWMH